MSISDWISDVCSSDLRRVEETSLHWQDAHRRKGHRRTRQAYWLWKGLRTEYCQISRNCYIRHRVFYRILRPTPTVPARQNCGNPGYKGSVDLMSKMKALYAHRCGVRPMRPMW